MADNPGYEIRAMQPDDWDAVARIYGEGLDTGNATFETAVPDWESWDEGHHEMCRLVIESDDKVIAWAALSPVSRRHVYRGVAEHSIYVDPDSRGRGFGRLLLRALIDSSEEAGFWTLQTSIFPENEASITLHTSEGFRILGIRERVGRHHGRWRDTVVMERRSPTVGS
jgi:L-amino acid N-acyltransferase YncA